jgi:hypothetical protein
VIIGLISALFNGIIALFILFNKRLHVHPMKIIMVIQLAESFSCYYYFTSVIICPYNLYVSFARFILPHCWETAECQLKALNIIKTFQTFMIRSSFVVMYDLTLFLAIDLILMIRYPFRKRETRWKIFIFAVVAEEIILTICYDSKMQVSAASKLWFFLILFLVIIVVCLFSLAYGLFKIRKNSISSDIVKTILKRHFLTMLAFILTNLYLVAGNVMFLMHPDEFDPVTGYTGYDETGAPFWVLATKYLWILKGFLMPFARLSEPIFFRILVEDTKNFFRDFRKLTDITEYDLKWDLRLVSRGLEKLWEEEE